MIEKVGIITPYGNHNYGNRLQNYAVTYLLQNMGFTVETLVLNRRKHTSRYLPAALKMFLKAKVLPLDPLVRAKLRHEYAKFHVFSKFTKRYIPTRLFCLFSEIKLKRDYTFFVVGSDQIWYPDARAITNVFFLPFAEPEQRVALAPSFGLSIIPEETKALIRDGLNGFPHLSVREEDGASLIKELTGREAEVLVDPTLMLEREQWLDVAAAPKFSLPKRYMFKYFLGKQTDKQRRDMEQLAQENGLEIVEIYNKDFPEYYATGPSEFLYMIDHADLVCTDSFHACVFSLLFDKPFLIHKRDGDGAGMTSRIDTLLKTFQLPNRAPGHVPPEQLFWHDYRHAYELLTLERKKVRDFLEKSMGKGMS